MPAGPPIAWMFAARLAWVRTTPLGWDVEPEVNWSSAGALGSVDSAARARSGSSEGVVTIARASGAKQRGDHLEVRDVLAGVAGIYERRRNEPGGRGAQEGREETDGLRDDERDAVASVETAGAEGAAQGAGRVAQRRERHIVLGPVLVHEGVGAGACRGIVERLRNGPNHREPAR